jgi:2-polyprenyl-3-methyl-5-hydroxy-6-metoxy-1,4-benzoquinol methylase
MNESRSEERMLEEVVAAASGRDVDELRRLTKEMSSTHRFAYALMRDTLHSAIFLYETLRTAFRWSRSRKEADELLQAMTARIGSLAHWRQQDNETIAAIREGRIDAAAMKPHIRLDAAAYDQFYADQSEEILAKLEPTARPARAADHVAMQLGNNIYLALRATHAVALVETILGAIKLLFEGETPIRWMDIGCGTGRFANSVNPRRFGVEKWEIVGCDLQRGKVAVANRRRARGRRFFVSDALQMFDDYKARGESFHLVSMFEFLEHLEDPLHFLRRLDLFKPKFIIAASPLAQNIGRARDTTPDRAHLWSFSRRGWEQMFELAGFEVVYSSEVRVGAYVGGLDWLTVLCGPLQLMKARRQTLGAPEAEGC